MRKKLRFLAATTKVAGDMFSTKLDPRLGSSWDLTKLISLGHASTILFTTPRILTLLLQRYFKINEASCTPTPT